MHPRDRLNLQVAHASDALDDARTQERAARVTGNEPAHRIACRAVEAWSVALAQLAGAQADLK